MTKHELNQTVLRYNDYLDKTLGVIRHICDDLQENELVPLQIVLPAIVEGLNWIYETAEGLVRFGMLTEIQLNGFKKLLPELMEAMERNDALQIHSIFRYDLPAALIEFKISNTVIN